jgi:hypothetical protein
MARDEHLPIYKQALDAAVHFESVGSDVGAVAESSAVKPRDDGAPLLAGGQVTRQRRLHDPACDLEHVGSDLPALLRRESFMMLPGTIRDIG